MRQYTQMGLDLSSLLQNAETGLSQGVSQILPSAEASVAQGLLADSSVQSQLQVTGANKLGASILANKGLWIGGAALALVLVYLMAKKS